MSDWEHAAENSAKCFDVAIGALRERLEKSKVVIGDNTIYNEDCRFVLPTIHNVDSIVTDPPYHLTSIVKRFGKSTSAPAKSNGETGVYKRSSRGFMGKTWDGGDIAFDPELWRLCFDALKPGGHLLAFGGTRTYHRMACAIEDAGFEIRDCIAWVYGSGFPKSHNLSDEWDGWGTAIKPAFEPIILARKPLSEKSVAANVAVHGTGALNIDASRIHAGDAQGGSYTVKRLKPGATLEATGGSWRPEDGVEYNGEMKPGRWPANFIHDGSEEVTRLFPETPGQQRSTGPEFTRKASVYGQYSDVAAAEPRNDAGSAARFFYCAKADKDDRLKSKHPTVKPIDLMAYLVRLVTPPGGVVLDPFSGSGATGMACMREGFKFILIEKEREYFDDILNRISHVHGEDTPLFAPPEKKPEQISLLESDPAKVG